MTGPERWALYAATEGSNMRIRLIGVLAAAVVLLGACSSSPTATPSASSTTADGGDKSTTTKGGGGDDESTTTTAKSRAKKQLPLDEAIPAAIEDIQTWWAAQMPDVYSQDFEAIPEEKIYPATPDNPAPGCGKDTPNYEDVQQNAFYCPLGQYVAYDDYELFPQLYQDYGAFATSIVLAHEWGHAVQDQVQVLGKYKTVLTEQQADCFAGAWTAHVYEDQPESIPVTPLDLQQGLAGMIQFKDPVGTDKFDPSAHGSGFDRANAFQEGFEQGPTRCAAYPEEPPNIQEIQFSSEEEYNTGGNLKYEDALTAATAELNDYWTELATSAGIDFTKVDDVVRFDSTTAMPKCGKVTYTEEEALQHIFYCATDNYVAWDDEWLGTVNNSVGDFAVAILLAKQWAASFQRQEGLSADQISSKTGELQQSCWAGAWAGDIAQGNGQNRPTQLTLSPGDLNEAIIAFLAFSDAPDDEGDSAKGTAFEHTRAFRDGFFNGPVQCDSYSQDADTK